MKFTTSKINYRVYNKEPTVIISAFDEWQLYLAGVQHRMHVLINHKNLIYFTTSRMLNWIHAHWLSFLSDYDFEILFRHDIQHGEVLS